MTSEEGSFTGLDSWRARDAWHLRLSFHNLVLVDDGSLVRVDATVAAFMSVEFAPQHAAEEITVAGAAPSLTKVRLAGPSRLVFRLRDDVAKVDATIDSLLNWDSWTPSLVPAAVPAGRLPPAPAAALRSPQDSETALEIPYRLIVSPDSTGSWSSLRWPVERGGRVEVWHTRLEGSLRAIWSPDYRTDPLPLPPPDPGFTTTLTPAERHSIVHLSANFAGASGGGNPPAPFEGTIMLTSTGGSLRAHGRWPVTAGSTLGLSEWEHLATEGRDHYVRTAHEGVLLPFGHRAAFVKVSERQTTLLPGVDDDIVAALQTRVFIVIPEPDRRYDGAAFEHGGREFPFSRGVRFTTLITPDLDPPQILEGTNQTFWVRRAGGAYPFSLEGTDHDGRPVPFQAPCLFVAQEDLANGPAGLQAAASSYLQGLHAHDRVASLNGRRVAFAASASDSSAAGHTDLATEGLELSVQVGTGVPVPVMVGASVRVPVLADLGVTTTTRLTLDPAFLEQGFEGAGNPLELFGRLDAVSLAFPADRSAGLATPSIAVNGLSRLRGPVGDADGLANGAFDPAAFFGDAKLLGGVSLADLISNVFEPEQLPRMVSERQPPGAAVPDTVVTSVDWAPAVVSNSVITWQPVPGGRPPLELHTRAEVRTSGAPRSSVTATLRAFTISIPDVANPYVSVAFEELRCELADGGKPHVSATLSAEPLTFGGPLTFVNELRRYLPSDGFNDPPFLDLTPSGLDAGYTLALPPVSVGVFNLQDLALGASLHLPFTGTPARLRLAFSERSHPCVLTVSLFGGGAFLALAGGTDGIETIEGALEFGGSFALNLVVATGGVTAMAGIYFKYDRAQSPGLTLAGYLRASGEVSVLGIVSVSVDFMLTLSWQDDGKVQGEAALTVKVDVLFFSKSVSLRLHKGYGGTSGDPTFADLMPTPEDWSAYAEAFG